MKITSNLIKISIACLLAMDIFAADNKIDYDKYILGKSFFEKPWVASPASTTARDGLGPLFNQNACINCHPKGGRSDKFIITLDNPNTIYGVQINTQSSQNIKKEADIIINYTKHIVTYPDGSKVILKKPVIKLINLGYGKINSNLSMRISPSLHGVGLLEQIKNKPHSRFNLVAGVDSVLRQVAIAAHNDMGLTNPFYPKESCTTKQLSCQKLNNNQELDLPKNRLEAITYFVKNLNDVSNIKAHTIFNAIGCNSCHTPSYKIKNRVIYPYTDLLTHNLGEGKFRTAPLWNSRKQKNFMHDGRANNIEEAVLWHNQDAGDVKLKFMQLDKNKRVKLLKFIEKL